MDKYNHLSCPICGNKNLDKKSGNFRCDICCIEFIIKDLHIGEKHENGSYQVTIEDVLNKSYLDSFRELEILETEECIKVAKECAIRNNK